MSDGRRFSVRMAGRSLMAAGWLRHFARDQVEVCSAGSESAVPINPAAVEATREVGIDVTGQTPNRLEYETAEDFDVIITMGCGDVCAVFLGNAARAGSSATRPARASRPSPDRGWHSRSYRALARRPGPGYPFGPGGTSDSTGEWAFSCLSGSTAG
jgi:protein-tyrosine-phosphatase